jgi:L-iditol 2-dehydrogenase
MNKMKALVLVDRNRFEVQDVSTPEPRPDEVLVAVKACGICGSDVHGMDGSTGRRKPPIIMGHEAAGVIAAKGADVGEWTEGQRVTFDSTISCGECAYCKRGEVNLCDRRRVLGVSCDEYRQHGGFAEYVAVPARILYPLPLGLRFEEAALAEPFAIALHAVSRVPVSHDSTVVVLGAGMIGLALTQALKERKCKRLIVIDIAEDRLRLAESFGATTINSARVDAIEAIRSMTDGEGADISFEAVGVAATIDLALKCLRKGGSAALVGNVAPSVPFPLQVVVTRELSVYGSCAARGEFVACLEKLACGSLRAAPLISATAALKEGAQWFDRLYKREPGLLKVVLVP